MSESQAAMGISCHQNRRYVRLAQAMAAMCLLAATAVAQYPTRTQARAKPQAPTVRAVGVLEWIGEEGKPTASRLIPISIFINGNFQDAGLYLARPEPMALDSGTRYEIQKAGNPSGYFDLSSAGRLPVDRYDTLWVGLGVWKPLEAVKPQRSPRNTQRNPTRAPEVAIDDGQPHLLRRPGSESTDTTNSSTDKKTSTTSGPTGNTSSSGNSGGPVLNRRSNSGSDTNSTPTGTIDNSGDGNPPDADDPDRPHLHRPPPQSTSSTANSGGGSADTPETNLAKLGDDPNRPTLHHGKPTDGPNAEPEVQLQGEPILMQQRVAVSDAAPHEVHTFLYHWADENSLTALKVKLEALAQKAIAGYVLPQPAVQPATTKPAPKAASSRARLPVKTAAPKPPDNSLTEESLSSYELAYDSGVTMVYSAHTPGDGAQRRYVTLVAQTDIYDEPSVLLTSVTDEAHLDQTPQMKLVDAVDADGSNRAELLFELRAQKDRQFALYRVYRGTATQVFLTGELP
jgi:hypothetical protein